MKITRKSVELQRQKGFEENKKNAAHNIGRKQHKQSVPEGLKMKD
jgi:hypothetical protein